MTRVYQSCKLKIKKTKKENLVSLSIKENKRIEKIKKKSSKIFVPNVNRMLNRTFPICVLVNNCSQNLIQMIAVGIPYISFQYFRSSFGFDAILNVFRIKCKICLSARYTNQKIVPTGFVFFL